MNRFVPYTCVLTLAGAILMGAECNPSPFPSDAEMNRRLLAARTYEQASLSAINPWIGIDSEARPIDVNMEFPALVDHLAPRAAEVASMTTAELDAYLSEALALVPHPDSDTKQELSFKIGNQLFAFTFDGKGAAFAWIGGGWYNSTGLPGPTFPTGTGSMGQDDGFQRTSTKRDLRMIEPDFVDYAQSFLAANPRPSRSDLEGFSNDAPLFLDGPCPHMFVMIPNGLGGFITTVFTSSNGNCLFGIWMGTDWIYTVY